MVYGTNVMITCFCIQALSNGFRKRSTMLLMLVVISQFAISTVHIASIYYQLAQGFLRSPVPEAYLNDPSSAAHITEEFAYFTNNLVADGVLIWRLFVVWSPRRWICLPFVLMAVGHALCGLIGTSLFINANRHLQILNRWLLVTGSLTVATQALASLLIACRMVWLSLSSVSRHRSIFWSMTWTVVESGAVLGCASILVLAFFAEKRNAAAVIGSIVGQLACLVPSSIILRVTAAEARTEADAEFPLSSSGMLTSVQCISRWSNPSAFACSDIEYPCDPPHILEDKWKNKSIVADGSCIPRTRQNAPLGGAR